MKLRMHVIAEFDVNPEHYPQPATPDVVLEVEKDNLEMESVYNYIHIFDEHKIVTKLEVIE